MGKRICRTGIIILFTISMFLYNWIFEAQFTIHTYPTIPKTEIYSLIKQRDLSFPQLQIIANQTGLNPQIVHKMLLQGRGMELLDLQAAYFAPVTVVNEPSSILTVSEYIVDEEGEYAKGTKLVDVRKGDILITKNSRFLGWRNGHVGVVVDAKRGLVLEALMLGLNTKLCSLEKWERLPAVQVLRLKEGEGSNELENISFSWLVGSYASEFLIDIPYSLLAGLGNNDTIKSTQCAHLAWYAYKQFGIDLDSDGGLLVTPADIQASPYLEVVQSYGY